MIQILFVDKDVQEEFQAFVWFAFFLLLLAPVPWTPTHTYEDLWEPVNEGVLVFVSGRYVLPL